MQAVRRVKREEGSFSLFLFPEKNVRALEPQAHLKSKEELNMQMPENYKVEDGKLTIFVDELEFEFLEKSDFI